MTSNTNPRVSVGMPVYNGAKHLESALQDITSQSLKNIEIIISDNGSSDETAEICKKFYEQDARIKYYRQPQTISATDNFNFVLKKATAPYFMWAAHDDTRSSNFIEKLHTALENNPEAVLAFGDIEGSREGNKFPVKIQFDSRNVKKIAQLRRTAVGQLHHLYGLWRRDKLNILEWKHNEWWHDTPPMLAASMLGDFIYVEGVVFKYLYNKHPFFDARFNAALVWRRIKDLARLVYLSVESVTKVKNPFYGLLAGLFVLEKILRDIIIFIIKRLKIYKPASH